MNASRLAAWLCAAWTRLTARPPGFAQQLDRALLDGQRVTLRLAALERSLYEPPPSGARM